MSDLDAFEVFEEAAGTGLDRDNTAFKGLTYQGALRGASAVLTRAAPALTAEYGGFTADTNDQRRRRFDKAQQLQAVADDLAAGLADERGREYREKLKLWHEHLRRHGQDPETFTGASLQGQQRPRVGERHVSQSQSEDLAQACRAITAIVEGQQDAYASPLVGALRALEARVAALEARA